MLPLLFSWVLPLFLVSLLFWVPLLFLVPPLFLDGVDVVVSALRFLRLTENGRFSLAFQRLEKRALSRLVQIGKVDFGRGEVMMLGVILLEFASEFAESVDRLAPSTVVALRHQHHAHSFRLECLGGGGGGGGASGDWAKFLQNGLTGEPGNDEPLVIPHRLLDGFDGNPTGRHGRGRRLGILQQNHDALRGQVRVQTCGQRRERRKGKKREKPL